jgi:hypothetical protein
LGRSQEDLFLINESTTGDNIEVERFEEERQQSMPLFQLNLCRLVGKLFLIVIVVIFLPLTVKAEEHKTMLLRKDGKVIRVPILSDAKRIESAYVDEEGLKKSQEAFDEFRKSQGLPPAPVFVPPPEEQRDPNEIETFQLPEAQLISGCIYTKGSSFPNYCFDEGADGEESKVIFEAGKDPQTTLDAIKASQGITGEYNVVPEGYAAKPKDDDETDQDLIIEKKPTVGNSTKANETHNTVKN